MAQPAPEHRMSVADYLAFEESSPVKHEYADGQLFAMAAASDEHNRIVRNIGGLLWQGLRGKPCQSYQSDMKVQANHVFYYPDAMVSCDPRDTKVTPENRYYKSHPCLIVEVLSGGTERIDRGEKLQNYRTIPELMIYVLADQHRSRLEVYRRADAGKWMYETLEGDETLELGMLEVRLSLRDVYEGVEFTPGEPMHGVPAE